MNTVIQTFGYLQEKVQVLETEKSSLQIELAKVREDYAEKIRMLKERVAELQKELERQ
jgi:phage host-nuclease inhibitor protein Gam